METKLESKRWSLNEFIHFCLMTILSGAMIAICATSSLLANGVMKEFGKFVGAILFSLGIFVILAYDMKLFTGLVATIPHMKLKNLWKLPTCFIGNAIGVAIVAVLVYFSPVSNVVVSGAKSVISAKLYSENWAISSLCSGVLCGILITLSVLSVNHSHKKGLSANVGVIFPIIVFAFCGFDHSVANMFYFYYLGEVSWQVVGYIMLTVLGNVIGGVVLPLVIKLKDENEL